MFREQSHLTFYALQQLQCPFLPDAYIAYGCLLITPQNKTAPKTGAAQQ